MKIKFENPALKFCAAVSAYAFTASNAFAAAAANDLTALSTQVSGEMYNGLQVVSTGAYCASAAFGLGAMLKFRAHAQDPGQTPIGQPAGRLIAAAGCAGLPYLIGVATASLGADASGNQIDGITGTTNRF